MRPRACHQLQPVKSASRMFVSCKKAEQVDAEYGLLLFRIARLLDQHGKTLAALEHYCRARDQDICPLRITSRHEEILERVAKETDTPLLDAAKMIADQAWVIVLELKRQACSLEAKPLTCYHCTNGSSSSPTASAHPT